MTFSAVRLYLLDDDGSFDFDGQGRGLEAWGFQLETGHHPQLKPNLWSPVATAVEPVVYAEGTERSGFSDAWPHDWGLADIPESWEHLDVAPIVRCREMVFVDGSPLRQLLSPLNLAPGDFWVSELDDRISLIPPPGVELSQATVEVAVRSGIFVVRGRSRLSVNGIRFQHDNSGPPMSGGSEGAALKFTHGCSDITIQNCEISHNNWIGLSLALCRDVRSWRNVANHNGHNGSATFQLTDLESEGDEFSYNNWRGAQGGFFGWSVGGSKNSLVHRAVYRGLRLVGNEAVGIWFDTDCEDVLLENLYATDNLNGMFFESIQGPITVDSGEIFDNHRMGVVASFSNNISLVGNQIFGHPVAEIGFSTVDYEPFTNFETQEVYSDQFFEDWALLDNQIRADSTGWGLFYALDEVWPISRETLYSDWNTWYREASAEAFAVGPDAFDLPGWRLESGQDWNSVYEDPFGARQ